MVTTGTIIQASDINPLQLIRSNPASYVVWFDGSSYHADAMSGGPAIPTGSDPAVVIQGAINNA